MFTLISFKIYKTFFLLQNKADKFLESVGPQTFFLF